MIVALARLRGERYAAQPGFGCFVGFVGCVQRRQRVVDLRGPFVRMHRPFVREPVAVPRVESPSFGFGEASFALS